jgi:hypothetical protein
MVRGRVARPAYGTDSPGVRVPATYPSGGTTAGQSRSHKQPMILACTHPVILHRAARGGVNLDGAVATRYGLRAADRLIMPNVCPDRAMDFRLRSSTDPRRGSVKPPPTSAGLRTCACYCHRLRAAGSSHRKSHAVNCGLTVHRRSDGRLGARPTSPNEPARPCGPLVRTEGQLHCVAGKCRINDQGGAPRRAAGPVPAAGSALGGAPAAHRANTGGEAGSGRFIGTVLMSGAVFLAIDLSSSRPPRLGRPFGPSHAIGYADPRDGDRSPGFGAYEGDGGG